MIQTVCHWRTAIPGESHCAQIEFDPGTAFNKRLIETKPLSLSLTDFIAQTLVLAIISF
jgi:hypothetical protein